MNLLIALKITLEDLASMRNLVDYLMAYHFTFTPYLTMEALKAAGSIQPVLGRLEVKSTNPPNM